MATVRNRNVFDVSLQHFKLDENQLLSMEQYPNVLISISKTAHNLLWLAGKRLNSRTSGNYGASFFFKAQTLEKQTLDMTNPRQTNTRYDKL